MTHYPETPTDPDVTRQVLAQTEDLMVVAFRFAHEGAEGRTHRHPHTQSTYVATGRFRFTVGQTSRDIGPGDALVIPGDTDHGCLCLAPGTLIDTFTPRRDDFL